jgi:group I intron endonuclease
MFGVVYIATNLINNKRYVGITKRPLQHRISQHLWVAKNQNKTYFHRAINKYGEEAILFQPFVSALKQEWLSDLEKQIILQEKPEYNQTNGGEVTIGRKYDDKTKEIIRIKNTGKKRSLEHCKQMSEIKKNLYKNEEVKQKAIDILNKARKNVDEAKRIQAVSISAKNRVWSEESKAKLSSSRKGIRYSQDVIDRMRISKTKKVLCVNTNIVFNNRHEAAQHNGISEKSVWRVCNGHFPSVKGLIFKYLEN